jgi:tetratricopeptide (TPR) repeat protein
MWVSINGIVPASAGAFVGFRFTPDLPNPMQYLGTTKVQSNYLESQAWFWKNDLSYWSEERINTIFTRYLERDADPLYFMYEEAKFYAMIGHYDQAVELYETLLISINDRLHCEIEEGEWFTLQRAWIELALGKVYCGKQDWEKAGQVVENVLSNDQNTEAIRMEAGLLDAMVKNQQLPHMADMVLKVSTP